MSAKYCAWCGSSDTHFMGYICWEEDERGNEILVNDLNHSEFTPKEEKHWCNGCDGAFIEPLPGEDYPTLPDEVLL